MLRGIFWATALFLTLIVGCESALKEERLLHYVERHRHEVYSPKIHIVAGHMQGFLQRPESAEQYFQTVFEKYPDSPYADEAYVWWVQSQEGRMVLPLKGAIALYETYLEKYPKGDGFKEVKEKLERMRTRL